MAESRGMVILGAGHTGGRAAHTLREAGWNGPVTLIGAEPSLPYERPSLSKGMLSGEKAPADFALYPEGDYARLDIVHLAATAAVEIRRRPHEAVLTDGTVVGYDKLLIATGAEPRRPAIPGADLVGVSVLRDIADAELLRRRIGPGKRLIVLGGGFIGLEVAAHAVSVGADVVVVEAGPRLLMRAVPPEIEARMRARHEAAGVDIRLGRKLDAILGEGAVSGVRLDDGSEIAAEAVLIAIGIEPRVGLAVAAGLAVDNGIVVDRHLRTDDPDIFAAGDVCSFAHDLYGAHVRLESWKNAEEQGPIAARNMLGGNEIAASVPWMWSDQYELTIQIAGFPDRAERVVAREAAPDALVLFHLAGGGRLVAASAVGPNATIGRIVRIGQMMIERGLRPDPRLLADPGVNLKTLMREQAA